MGKYGVNDIEKRIKEKGFVLERARSSHKVYKKDLLLVVLPNSRYVSERIATDIFSTLALA